MNDQKRKSVRVPVTLAGTLGLFIGVMCRFHGAAAQTPATLPVYPAPLNTVLGQLPLLTDAQTRSVSAENPTGENGKGGMYVPNLADPNLPHSGAATVLGQGWKVRPFLRVPAGQTVTLMDVDGPGIIQHIWIVNGDITKNGRSSVLRFYWDGEQTPSIEVPVADFFAVGHAHFAPVNSQVVTDVPHSALSCFWPMPFRRHARVTMSNDAEEDVGLLAYQITYAVTDVPENTGYFHAQWRRSSGDKENPYVILDNVRGRGQYVGTFLSLGQGRDGWFGEGEVKFYLDGDTDFPTYNGTGTEDYFIASYGFETTYSTPFAGVTLKENVKDTHSPDGNTGALWSMYRWHIMDPIHFQKDLKVTIQDLGWQGNKYFKGRDDIASVAYWYQSEPHTPFPPLPGVEERVRPALAGPTPLR